MATSSLSVFLVPRARVAGGPRVAFLQGPLAGCSVGPTWVTERSRRDCEATARSHDIGLGFTDARRPMSLRGHGPTDSPIQWGSLSFGWGNRVVRRLQFATLPAALVASHQRPLGLRVWLGVLGGQCPAGHRVCAVSYISSSIS